MTKNNLYLIQDPDRPMHVVADSWTQAVFKWKQLVALENEMKPEEVDEPQGIALIAQTNDLLC